MYTAGLSGQCILTQLVSTLPDFCQGFFFALSVVNKWQINRNNLLNLLLGIQDGIRFSYKMLVAEFLVRIAFVILRNST